MFTEPSYAHELEFSLEKNIFNTHTHINIIRKLC